MAEDTEIDDETALIVKENQEQFDDYIAIAVLLVLTAVACLDAPIPYPYSHLSGRNTKTMGEVLLTAPNRPATLRMYTSCAVMRKRTCAPYRNAPK